MRFAKYQGLGNDFILVDVRQSDVVLTPARVRALCDRRFGVGADGVLVIGRSSCGVASMGVHNADGGVAEMCGNGLRCVARYLRAHDPALPESYPVETGAGPLQITHLGDAVSVAMGGITDHGPVELRLATTLRGRFVRLGNPHFVVYGQWTREDALRLGPIAERHPVFPEGVNVSFATLRGDEVQLFVWERGCGLTMACGTGACATAAVGWLEGHLTPKRDVTVHLPGGQLQLGGTPEALEMRGAATLVFTGEWSEPELTAPLAIGALLSGSS